MFPAGSTVQAEGRALYLRNHNKLMIFLGVAAVIFVASLLGTYTRPYGQLAAFWPTNAVLLGMLVRYPVLARPAGWAGAAVGYLLAGWMAGDIWGVNLLLTVGNLSGVVVGYALFRRLDNADRTLVGAASVLKMVLIVALASASAAAVGAVIEPVLFSGRPVGGPVHWFIVEAVNYIAILPAVLTIPAALYRFRRRDGFGLWLRQLAPVGLLVLSLALEVWLGGAGAVAFPVLALLWCALALGLFPTALLTLLYSAWTLMAMSTGVLPLGIEIDSAHEVASVRLAVTLIAICPVMIASVMAARQALVDQLRYLAEHDPLTGVGNRRAFWEGALAARKVAEACERPSALLILDIDHFKQINDTFGHATGDQVIVRLAHCMRDQLCGRAHVVGRLGGEEFGIFLPDCGVGGASIVASMIVRACAESLLQLEDGRSVTATVSIGAAVSPDSRRALEGMMLSADAELYRAKRGGRNRFEVEGAVE